MLRFDVLGQGLQSFWEQPPCPVAILINDKLVHVSRVCHLCVRFSKEAPAKQEHLGKTGRSNALICTLGSVGDLRGKLWTQAGHRALKHAVVSLFVDHWVTFSVASASPVLWPVNLPSAHRCMTVLYNLLLSVTSQDWPSHLHAVLTR